MSIVENKVPEDLKSTKVVPLYKKGNKYEVGNFRPVSILSIVPKILERAVYIINLKLFWLKITCYMIYNLNSEETIPLTHVSFTLQITSTN